MEANDEGVIVSLKSGKRMKADCLLYANGRTGNTDSLTLENAGLEADSRGLLKVNGMYQTAQLIFMPSGTSLVIRVWPLQLMIRAG